jgi:D-alanyl-D-alanine dipeptidase
MSTYRQSPALSSFTAYAHDNMVFDTNGQPQKVDEVTYKNTPREAKLNKFGQVYQDNAPVWLHKEMADVVVDAAIYMQQKYGWKSVIYDGLRTVNGAYNMYRNAADSDLEQGLLAAPGLSAHNKGMAADLVQFDTAGKLVDMGGNFDHLDMKTNNRAYSDLPQPVLENRLKREIAFQHAALSQGKLFAPLRSEFWDERFPENEADHWRVLDSLTRCMGKQLLSSEDISNMRSPKDSEQRKAFSKKWELMSYDEFKTKWAELFDEKEMRRVFDLPDSVKLPPDRSTIVYHGDYNPLYDRDLIASGKNITDNALDLTLQNART